MRARNGDGGDLAGAISLREANDPETFAFRERMRRRLGAAGGDARYALDYALSFEEERVAVTQAADITRYQVTAKAVYLLSDRLGGEPVKGEIVARGVYDATAAPFATLAAQRDEKKRLAVELAERVSTRLLALAAKPAS